MDRSCGDRIWWNNISLLWRLRFITKSIWVCFLSTANASWKSCMIRFHTFRVMILWFLRVFSLTIESDSSLFQHSVSWQFSDCDQWHPRSCLRTAFIWLRDAPRQYLCFTTLKVEGDSKDRPMFDKVDLRFIQYPFRFPEDPWLQRCVLWLHVQQEGSFSRL